MIRISSPRIGMFKGEGQTVVNCGHINFWQRIHILTFTTLFAKKCCFSCWRSTYLINQLSLPRSVF